MSIDDKILRIDNLRRALKLQINSTYHSLDSGYMSELYTKQENLLKDKVNLLLQKERLEKLKKLNNIDESY